MVSADRGPAAPAALRDRLDRSAERHLPPSGEGRMVWRVWGAGRPLVLLHGGYGSWTHWLRNIEALAAHYRVIAADLPGLGESALPPDPAAPEAMAAIIDAGLGRLLPDGARFHLVGFSFGAMLGAFVARARGAGLCSFTLVGSASMGLRRAPMRKLGAVRADMSAAEMAALQRENLAILMFADPACIDDLAVDLQTENVRRARVKSRRFAPIDLLSPVLPQIRAPLGGLWGERDVTAFPYVEERRALLQKAQPGAWFDIIPGAGHWVQYEAAEPFNRALLARLAARDP